MIRGDKAIISDEELEHLAQCYLKLQKNKIFKKMSRDFQQFVNDYLDRQLKEYLKSREKKNGL